MSHPSSVRSSYSIIPQTKLTKYSVFRAIILLHDAHAHVNSPLCVSAYRILEASRAILDLIYVVRSTSYNIVLLDYFCSVSITSQ